MRDPDGVCGWRIGSPRRAGQRADKVAAHYGIDPKAIYGYHNCDSIKDNPAIDAVHVVLPNSMHREYTERVFAAGKHLLCE